ncbi:helix-turn-helix domain-containing protein [Altibacter sp. HG106]|uniref:helix-turn-helix domain-containing protein n=1 Tax=Altibacter sp. HG106 TaxID=3023937 RepID=UPI002350F686|nr:AraC family transcriptional regulator [Altibacter sp. HG106]MDC7993701.1 AraC family transcriptional regulator [Altibacter sp. HG106]
MRNTKTPTLEAIRPSFGSSLKVSRYENASNNLIPNWHFHPEMEIVYVNGGSGKRHIGNHISYYSDGDLLFIGANLPHFGFTDRLTGNKSEVVIQVKEDFLGPDFFDVPEMQSIKQLFLRGKQGIAFHQETMSRMGPRLERLETLEPYARLMEFLRILKDLADANDYTVLNVDQVVLESKPQDTERLDTIYGFVSNEFKRPISLSEVAQLVNMTPPAFSRYFKNKTNKTFTQFVNEYRLVHASKLLMEEQRSITDICFDCGFNNFSHFSKKFKAYTGKNPSDYRNELKKVYT